jgi:hypothetical protein
LFKLILTNGTSDAELYFRVKETPIAKKWFSELSKNYEIFEDTRFTNWGVGNLVEELNNKIEIINNYSNVIDRKLSDHFNQQDLNYLHTFFEDLRGEITQGTEWFNTAPSCIKVALEDFNILIHKIEAELRTTNHPTCVVTFKNRPTIELNDNDIKHFTFKWISGTVYINYCHVGKTVLDVFKDYDKIAKSVRPQTHYSADFMIKFGPSVPYLLYCLKKIVVTIWLKFQPFKFKNPNLGMIPVADLVGTFDYAELKDFKKVKGVYV